MGTCRACPVCWSRESPPLWPALQPVVLVLVGSSQGPARSQCMTCPHPSGFCPPCRVSGPQWAVHLSCWFGLHLGSLCSGLGEVGAARPGCVLEHSCQLVEDWCQGAFLRLCICVWESRGCVVRHKGSASLRGMGRGQSGLSVSEHGRHGPAPQTWGLALFCLVSCVALCPVRGRPGALRQVGRLDWLVVFNTLLHLYQSPPLRQS